MATVTQVTLTCDVCSNADDVETWTFGLDGKAYEIDLCRKDGNALGRITAGYISKARKVPARPDRRPQNAKAVAAPAARTAGVRQRTGIFVYGILPADIEVAAGVPGVGEHPGPLRDVRSGDLAALVSEVDLSGRLGSPGDLRAHREILDAIAAEVPVLPVRFGTVLASEDAVAEELLAAHRDEFTAALEQLEGRAEFLVKGCYVEELTNDAATASREQDTRALRQAMEGLCVAVVVREPADELYVAFLAAVEKEREVQRVIGDLARQWEGRIDLQLLGPMAAYDFAGTAQPE